MCPLAAGHTARPSPQRTSRMPSEEPRADERKPTATQYNHAVGKSFARPRLATRFPPGGTTLLPAPVRGFDANATVSRGAGHCQQTAGGWEAVFARRDREGAKEFPAIGIGTDVPRLPIFCSTPKTAPRFAPTRLAASLRRARRPA